MRALKKVLNIFKNIRSKRTSNKAYPEQDMMQLSDGLLKAHSLLLLEQMIVTHQRYRLNL